MSMSELEKLCTCEFGFRLGDGRTDTNRCMVHAMCREELLMVIAHDQEEDAASQQTVTTLQAQLEALEYMLREVWGWYGHLEPRPARPFIEQVEAALATGEVKP